MQSIPKTVKEKCRRANGKQLALKCAPYVIFGYVFNKVSWLYGQQAGDNTLQKVLDTINGMGGAFVNPFPSFMPRDLLVGVGCGIGFRMVVYYKAKNAKKFRQGVEYGSARWGTAKDMEPYVDPVFENNVLLTATERLMMSGRPKQPKYARNKNILVIGGSGSGKTRFFVKPNLMQMHSSYVVTDPKGTVLVECGRMLSKNDYRIKVLNTINFATMKTHPSHPPKPLRAKKYPTAAKRQEGNPEDSRDTGGTAERNSHRQGKSIFRHPKKYSMTLILRKHQKPLQSRKSTSA